MVRSKKQTDNGIRPSIFPNGLDPEMSSMERGVKGCSKGCLASSHGYNADKLPEDSGSGGVWWQDRCGDEDCRLNYWNGRRIWSIISGSDRLMDRFRLSSDGLLQV